MIQDDLDFIRRNTKLNRQEMCGVVFGLDCARTITPYLNWTLPIPLDNRPKAGRAKRAKRNQEYTSSSSNLSSASSSPTPSSPAASSSSSSSSFQFPNSSIPAHRSSAIISIVHLTDVHIDPYYESGTNADCGEPLCCRAADGLAQSPAKSAGPWGDYRNCDTPVSSLNSALDHIVQTHPNVSILTDEHEFFLSIESFWS